MPAADVESAYFEPIMNWRSAVNSTAGSPFQGVFAQQLAVAGKSHDPAFKHDTYCKF